MESQKNEATMFELSRNWWNYAFENPHLVKPVHTAIYLWNVELNNRLGWSKYFASPASQTMAACNITPKTYHRAFKDLVAWGFIEVIVESRNQFTANVIALPSAGVKNTEALTRAVLNQLPKQEPRHSAGTDQSTDCSTEPINKPQTSNLKPQTSNNTIQPAGDGLSDETNQQESAEGGGPVRETANDGNKISLEEPERKDPKEKSCAKKERGDSHRQRSSGPRKPAPENEAAPEKAPGLHTRIQQLIQDKRGGDYYWSSVDAGQVKNLINRIAFRWRNKYGTEPADDDVLHSLSWLIDNLPKRYRSKWSVKRLVSDFNEIMLEIEDAFENRNVNRSIPSSGYGHPTHNPFGWNPNSRSSLEEIAAIISSTYN